MSGHDNPIKILVDIFRILHSILKFIWINTFDRIAKITC